jgi:hypothetical protein
MVKAGADGDLQGTMGRAGTIAFVQADTVLSPNWQKKEQKKKEN